MWLGSCIAVAEVWASSYSSNLTPSLGTSICHKCGPKKTKDKKKKRKERKLCTSHTGCLKRNSCCVLSDSSLSMNQESGLNT